MTEYFRASRSESPLDKHRAAIAAQFHRARGDAPVDDSSDEDD
ncbi:MAG: hypothetical protein U0Q20_14305 [Mycobacterium sp.]